ncbi:GlxA family transcriptional regulator [Paenarthrobacter aurescens]|uniref:AraC family transcriptional regulator n=1 Tax=Paenarthrobacter aurescens TaxID=43663 RepID=A0A4Y3NCY7_PAEAU|nr:helix-turn-helix domain-containing protein [Paenarthrobacter aurescens]MDO6145410.1 helix-turn-helix domain-containing protein [Paenarthrobacter aurescens]MDO6149215.1 helix-turn-helix domain-containing protein [Paenarthrobacter aurescens]MDO6160459.1 helix-turn-helix domain-containing protein [Paenarthrobacter aurescens]MDO6164318.1 helix-turn-helix domain-containing protein [Paenarthrobacter aurescens]GEB19562.1 AraC family transcriptional regulator [Paenarthrobacter aurescens]
MRIAVYAFDGITMFHLAVPQMVFDEVSRQGLAEWTTVLFSDRAGSVQTAEGYTLGQVQGPSTAEQADVVVVPSWFDDEREPGGALSHVLQEAHARGATIVGLCLGAIPVADAGLLKGRSAVTHWQAFDSLTVRHPEVSLDQTVLYIDHGDVLTSAGTASGLDACLHLVRARLGSEAANQVARSLVIAPHREGGQAQYIEHPLPPRAEDDLMARLLEWAMGRLGENLSIDRLAAQAHMSRRTFVRAFRASTGTTPSAWIRTRRLDAARRLLETTDLSMDQVAAECGFGSAVTLRQNFAGAFSTSPTDYRRRFTA